MVNNDLLIKKLKSHFKETRDLSAPVIYSLIKALNNQEKYSPLLIETLDHDGFEIVTPKRQGLFVYETLASKPVLSSFFGLTSVAIIGLYPAYGIPIISVLSGAAFASIYYHNYFNQHIDDGYSDIQRSKEHIADFLRSLIGLKKLLSEFPEDLIPVDLKAKNIKLLISDLIDVIGYSIFSNLEKSNKIKIRDIVISLQKIKSLYSMGSHQELFFYDSIRLITSKGSREMDKSQDSQNHEAGNLNLGSEPDFSVKEDAISEGIKLAKELNKSEGKKPKKRKQSKQKINEKDHGASDSPETSMATTNSDHEHSSPLPSQHQDNLKNAEKDPFEIDHATNQEHEFHKAEDDKTEISQENPGESMPSREPVLNVYSTEDEELLDALDEMDEDDGFELPGAVPDNSSSESDGYDESELDGLLNQMEKGE